MAPPTAAKDTRAGVGTPRSASPDAFGDPVLQGIKRACKRVRTDALAAEAKRNKYTSRPLGEFARKKTGVNSGPSSCFFACQAAQTTPTQILQFPGTP